jgi:asparagine N-glycosylation enzyme membrane subunit Stt3
MLPRILDSRYPVIEIFAAVLAAISSFVELHIWSPAYTYFMLLFLVMVDVMVNNHIKGQPNRPKFMLLIMLAYTLVLAFAHAFGKHEVGPV